jgi:hypothetical protein
MMSFLPVFTVENWRYYTVIGGPNNRLTGNGKNRVGNISVVIYKNVIITQIADDLAFCRKLQSSIEWNTKPKYFIWDFSLTFDIFPLKNFFFRQIN